MGVEQLRDRIAGLETELLILDFSHTARGSGIMPDLFAFKAFI